MTRNFLDKAILGLFSSALLITACNIFNPTGNGPSSSDADAQVSLGQTKIREKDFGGAMKAFASAIEQDSTNSMAYYGYAKAAMQYYNISATGMLSEVTDAQAKKKIPFLQQEDTLKTRFLQGLGKVKWALAHITKRDTLSQWFNYSKNPDSKEALKDINRQKRIDFIMDHIDKAERLGMPGYYRSTQFPLSDMAMGYMKIAPDLGFAEMIYAVLKLQDLDNNDTIDSRDNLVKNLNINIENGFSIEGLKDIQADLVDNDTARQNINNLIKNVSGGLSSASNMVSLISTITGQSADSNSLDSAASSNGFGGEITGNVDSLVTSLGSSITFYQFGDGIDNDGDGCVDEEILDGKDNDGDGLVDEDARVKIDDGVDNDQDGDVDEEDERTATFTNPLSGDFALLFTKQAGWVEGDMYKDKAFKARIQSDSLQPGVAGQESLLDTAKARIGGCWNNWN